MDALAFAGPGALVFVRATRASIGADGRHPCAALVTFHASPDAASDPIRSGCCVVSFGFFYTFDDTFTGVGSRATSKLADQFGVGP